jgi:hypothetical protein
MNETLIAVLPILFLLMCSRRAPKAPPPPPPAPEGPTEEEKAAIKEEEKKRTLKARGRESTILTGGAGLTSSTETINTKSLLGR